MNINSETKYCQTCGIPLDIDYTNLKADQNEEYCDYCLKMELNCMTSQWIILSTFGDFFPKNTIKKSAYAILRRS